MQEEGVLSINEGLLLMRLQKILMITLLTLLIGAFFALDLQQYMSLEYFKAQRDTIGNLYQQKPLVFTGGFFVVYILVAGLSLPGAGLLTLAAGALFGLEIGILVVSFASTIGATLAFLVSRFLLRDFIQRRFRTQIDSVNNGIEKDGAFYLFTLRLVPVFPFFLINVLMGLTPITARTFYFVSQIGMLAGTAVYVNAGMQIAEIDSFSGILSPSMLLAFALLGVFPLLAKKLIAFVKRRSQVRRYPKPKYYDANLVVIGGGAAGLVSSYIAAAVKAKVILIEKHKMGGDCLNTGCVPSKALIRSAKIKSYFDRAEDYGLQAISVDVPFQRVMQRVQRIIERIAPHDSIQRYRSLGVECIQGEAELLSPYCVRVNGREINTRHVIIASGARPFVPQIEGLESSGYLTSDTIWDLDELPERLLVLGGGPIGCELTQAFARLGARVTQVEQQARLMMREDIEVSGYVHDRFVQENIDVRTSHKALRVITDAAKKQLVCSGPDGKEVSIPFDAMLIAVGRSANTHGFGLEELGVELNAIGTIAVNEYQQSSIPSIYACGDVSGPYQFTHTAAHQAWYASVNALFGAFKRFRVDYSVIPWATFTDPEIARVGLNEQEAKEEGTAYEVTQYGIDDLDRAIADEEAHGFVKVLTRPKSDKILGVTVVGSHAGEVIAEYVSAMKHGIGLNKVLSTIHIYPTLTESNKYVAGEWKRAHVSKQLLTWVERFHGWRRGAPNVQGAPLSQSDTSK